MKTAIERAHEAAARATLRSEIDSYRESEALLDEHIEWWRNGKDDPESCVHYSTIGVAFRRAEIAISAFLAHLAEDEEAVEGVGLIIETKARIIAEGGEDDGIANIEEVARAALAALKEPT